ncbi:MULTISPECIES: hypothetical protein [unclassified Isoptericola]|uniref:hypothetical protein n=1 Tax=unclassified Isoptericola TaxID=2623355 RepID=UPI00364A4917
MSAARYARVPAALTALALAALVAACGGPEGTTVHDEVEWADGAPPSGDPESDPRVEAVRRYDTLLKASTNELDLSDPRLAEVTTPEWLDIQVDGVRRDVEAGRLRLWAGPKEMTVLDVSSDGDEAMVLMCSRLPASWVWDDDTSAPEEWSSEPGSFEYDTFTLVQVDDAWLVDVAQRPYGPDTGECDPGPDVPVGTFTTQPDLDLLSDASPDDVVAPSS